MNAKWVKTAAVVAACAAAVYAMIYADVVLRARSAYMEGEKYWLWNEQPALKKAALDAKFEADKAALDKQLAKGRLDKDAYDRKLEAAKVGRDEKMNESSIKYAYIWYQTAVELFSPPESRYVKLAREKMPKAKELWKQELRAKKIPFEDYMLE